MTNNKTMKEFWEEKERILNEKVIYCSIATYVEGHPEFQKSTKGLLYLMSESLNFENFEGASWGLPLRRSVFLKTAFRIPLYEIESANIIKLGNFNLKKLFKSFLKPDSTTLKIKHFNHGAIQVLYFSDVLPLDKWEVLIEKAIKLKTLKYHDSYFKY